MRMRATVKLVRSGHVLARLSALRDGQAGVRVAVLGAALRLGVLDLLAETPCSAGRLAERLADASGPVDRDLLDAFLHVLAADGRVRLRGDRWELTRRGSAVVGDDVVRAAYEGFSDYHVGLYRDLPAQLRGGAPRTDVTDRADVIARLSQALDPFVHETLTELVGRRGPLRVLDVGCGAGLQLTRMLEAAPRAFGVGVESDARAAEIARRTLAEKELSDRASVLTADLRDVLGAPEAIGGRVDFALMANVVYYLPLAERPAVLRGVADLLAPGGTLLVVTTVLTDAFFSRHFDLLLRAQAGAMELPHVPVLTAQLAAAGLAPEKPRRIAPGEPLVAVAATLAG